jgi:transposase
MHLERTRSSYKDTHYSSYRIARSVRKDGKVVKEILFPLGQLSDQQATQIKLILCTLRNQDGVLVALDDVIPSKALDYLDVAVANRLWDEWNLDSAFVNGTDSALSTKMVARILTINRCINPCSHYSIPKWIERTALPQILEISIDKLNDDKLYYELDKIEANKSVIEKHIFEVTKSKNPKSYDFVNYDLSSSYFMGIRCELSRFGKSKDNQNYQRQVVLALLVNSEGYPFKWDVFPGNQAEVHTLEGNIDACRRLDLESVTMVFDRGLVSKKNLALLCDKEKKTKFISALDKPQIPKVKGLNLVRIPEKSAEKTLGSLPGFVRFDDKVFYKDLDVIDGLRYVFSFNVKLLREERMLRRQKLRQFDRFIKELNAELAEAKRDRDLEATKAKVLAQLRKLKIKRFYEDPVLESFTVEVTTKTGTTKTVASFQAKVKRIPPAIDEAKLLDGTCVFISNHVEKRGRGFAMNAKRILQAYRDKTEIEDAFKNMKSFLKIRPFFVNIEQHVRAVFTICVLAYHLNKSLALKRKQLEGYDYLNSRELYDPFKDSKQISMTDPATGSQCTKIIPPCKETQKLLKNLGLSALLKLKPPL